MGYRLLEIWKLVEFTDHCRLTLSKKLGSHGY